MPDVIFMSKAGVTVAARRYHEGAADLSDFAEPDGAWTRGQGAPDPNGWKVRTYNGSWHYLKDGDWVVDFAGSGQVCVIPHEFFHALFEAQIAPTAEPSPVPKKLSTKR